MPLVYEATHENQTTHKIGWVGIKNNFKKRKRIKSAYFFAYKYALEKNKFFKKSIQFLS